MVAVQGVVRSGDLPSYFVHGELMRESSHLAVDQSWLDLD